MPDVNPTLERAFGRWSRARLIDAARHVEAGGAIAETEAVGDVAEDMDPTRLAGDLGIDVVKSGMEPTMAVGGDKAELASDEPAGGEGEEKGFPAAVTFAGHEPEVEEFPAAVGQETIRGQGHAAAGAIGRAGPEAHGIEKEIGPVVGEGPTVKRLLPRDPGCG